MTAVSGILFTAATLVAQGPAVPPAPWRGAGATPCVGTDGGIFQCPPAPRTIAVRAGRLFDSKTGQMLTRQLVVLQGERELAKDNWELGRFDLQFEPVAKGLARVGVQFEIDSDGILHVLARDTRTGRESVIELSSAVDVSDEAVCVRVIGLDL